MRRFAIGLVFLSLPMSTAPGDAVAPKCLKAEVNPVTGHVLCIDPLGAAVEPPPPEAALPCKKPEEARGSGATARTARLKSRGCEGFQLSLYDCAARKGSALRRSAIRNIFLTA